MPSSLSSASKKSDSSTKTWLKNKANNQLHKSKTPSVCTKEVSPADDMLSESQLQLPSASVLLDRKSRIATVWCSGKTCAFSPILSLVLPLFLNVAGRNAQHLSSNCFHQCRPCLSLFCYCDVTDWRFVDLPTLHKIFEVAKLFFEIKIAKSTRKLWKLNEDQF